MPRSAFKSLTYKGKRTHMMGYQVLKTVQTAEPESPLFGHGACF